MFSSFLNRTRLRRGSTMGNSSSSGADGDGNGSIDEDGRRRPGLASRGLSHRIVGGGSNNNAHRAALPHLTLPSSLPSPFRSGGSLGLTRAELDARCQPSGLYPTCEWEQKQIRRLISNGHLAARIKGSDARLTKTDHECPICFMYYSESNVAKCCNATLCTECYLQVKPQKDRHTTCPYCNNPKMAVTVQRGMDEGDVAKREEEEQRVIEATIRSRISRLHGEGPVTNNDHGGGGTGAGENRDEGETASEGSFGSSLEHYNRARASSISSNISGASNSDSCDPPHAPVRPADDDSSALLSLAMSPADRRALESEMRAQLSHETHRRTEREAEEARMRHAQEWYGSQAGRTSRVREARLAELTGLLERMGARGGGAASASGDTNENGEGENPLMAAGADARGAARHSVAGGGSLSRLLRAIESSSNSRGGGGSGGRSSDSGLEDLMRVTAAFSPEDLTREDVRRMDSADLIRLTAASFLGSMDDAAAANAGSRAARQERSLVESGLLGTNDDDGDDDVEPSGGLGGLERFGRFSSSPFGLGSGSGSARPQRRVVRRLAGNRGVSSTHMDTAELLMRGVSEEEQLEMAIAMSMQDAQEEPSQQTEAGDGEHRRLEEGGIAEESGEEEDNSSSSSGSSSSSSDSSSEGRDNQSNTAHDEGGNNASDDDADVDAVSSEEGEGEVRFTDLASV